MKFKYLICLSVVSITILTSCGGGVQVSPTPVPTSTVEPTQVKPPDLSAVQLKADDLPDGYKQLTDEEAKELGLVDIDKSFSSIAEGANTHAAFYLNQSQNNFGIIITILAHPLSTKLVTSLAAEMSNPEVAAEDILKSMKDIKNPTIKTEYSGIGDGSFGISGAFESNAMMMDIIMAYSGNTMEIVMYMYTNVSKVDLKSVAQKLDEHVRAAYP